MNPSTPNALPGLSAVVAHFRAQEQQRIAVLHQQADSEDWHGQVFRRISVEMEPDAY